VRRADNPTTFMYRASTYWTTQGLSRSVMGLLYHYLSSLQQHTKTNTAN